MNRIAEVEGTAKGKVANMDSEISMFMIGANLQEWYQVCLVCLCREEVGSRQHLQSTCPLAGMLLVSPATGYGKLLCYSMFPLSIYPCIIP